MIFNVNSNEIEIISEDSVEAKYLESFFTNSIYLKMQIDFVRQGFHVTNEECVCIKLSKGDTA